MFFLKSLLQLPHKSQQLLLLEQPSAEKEALGWLKSNIERIRLDLVLSYMKPSSKWSNPNFSVQRQNQLTSQLIMTNQGKTTNMRLRQKQLCECPETGNLVSGNRRHWLSRETHSFLQGDLASRAFIPKFCIAVLGSHLPPNPTFIDSLRLKSWDYLPLLPPAHLPPAGFTYLLERRASALAHDSQVMILMCC